MNYSNKKATETDESMFWYWTFIACGLSIVLFFFLFPSLFLFLFLSVFSSEISWMVCLFFRWWRNFVDGVFFFLLNWFEIFVIFQWIFSNVWSHRDRLNSMFCQWQVLQNYWLFYLPLHRMTFCARSLSIFMGFSWIFFSLYCKHVWHGYPPVMHHVSTNTYRTTSLSNEN